MIVIAMPEELALVRETDEPILITGVGALNVIKALSNVPRETPIRNIGYAGSNLIPKGTRCKIGRVRLYHPVADFNDITYALGGDTPCFTSADFVTATNIQYPCVFDMELAFILAMGFSNVSAEKIISDNLSLKEFNVVIDA